MIGGNSGVSAENEKVVLLKNRWLPVVLFASVFLSTGCKNSQPETSPAVMVGEVPSEYKGGEVAFIQFCSGCHGPSAAGTPEGPSFINKIYEPGHHGDPAFILAARMGVRAHHWNFGDMPKIDGVSDVELGHIISYIRWLQRQAGIN